MKIIETDRLILRRLSINDAPFILKLLNDPSWLRFIGDKGVRTGNANEWVKKNKALTQWYERELCFQYFT
ncbi:GNAT family N-acetyltransferase [Rossellomorea sp. BNER]|uniref:GNAT family N-acetyltransferase n=1 Tax=Rossellomorea sp. BNER TaxID=2962031 RepID=UPI003AF1EA28